jgi:relaxase-like protein
MIVKISGSGRSFSGLATYLTHDPKAETNDRVAWTHTHNLANDFVPSAVDEMLWTSRDAEILKQEAGVRAGGRSTERPAKHISLNWAIEDNPSQQHMIATGEHFLRSMGWSEHQAIFVAHSDKSYKHVHLLLNEVHPETGLQLNDGFEQRRAQKWALAYEREQGVIRCEQRGLNPEEREKAMPRNMWMAFKKNEQEFQKSEELLQQNADIPEYSPKTRKKEEWEILKEIQRDERKQHFADGKIEFRELRQVISREIREEFRERWADYYLAVKNGTEADRDILAQTKAQLLADRKAALEPRADAACAELKKTRDVKYRDLLDNQKAVRREFGERLEAGLDNAGFFLDLTEKKTGPREAALAFREASIEVTGSFQGDQPRSPLHAEAEHTPDRHAASHRQGDIADMGRRQVLGTAGAVADSLFSFLTNLGSAPPKPVSAEERRGEFREAAENAVKQQHQQHEREEDDARWHQRQRAYGE